MSEVEEVLSAPNAAAAESVMRGMSGVVDELDRLRAENRDLRKNCEWMQRMGWSTAAEEMDRLRDRVVELENQTLTYPTEDELSPEMRARLMPEGMQWPRFEDGEPVKPGDWIDDDGREMFADAVVFRETGASLTDPGMNYEVYLSPGERVKRPEPAETAACGKTSQNGPNRTNADRQVGKASQNGPESVGKASRLSDSEPKTGDNGKEPAILSDSWEKLEEDAEDIRRTIAYHFGDIVMSDDPSADVGDGVSPTVQTNLMRLVRRARALAGEGE